VPEKGGFSRIKEVTVDDGNILEIFQPSTGSLITPEQVAVAEAYARASKAPSTLRAYTSRLRIFDEWCRRHGEPTLPSAPEVVAVFLGGLAKHKTVQTVEGYLAAISEANRLAGHPPPSVDERVRVVMKGIRRKHGTPSRGKAALSVGQLRLAVGAMPADLNGTRDAAILLVGFAGALRRSEVSALEVRDLTFRDEGLQLMIRRSKGDQDGQGCLVGVPFGSHRTTCPVRTLKKWMAAAHVVDGALFRPLGRELFPGPGPLSPDMVSHAVKKAVSRIGLDPHEYGGHSLRAGMVTAAAMAGIDSARLSQHTRHQSLATLRRYIRPATIFQMNPAAMIGL